MTFESLLKWGKSALPEMGQPDAWLRDIHSHALAIASISLSPGLEGDVMVCAVNPLFYGKFYSVIRFEYQRFSADVGTTAAKHIESTALKPKIWAMLQYIETHWGFHTQSRLTQLQTEDNHGWSLER